MGLLGIPTGPHEAQIKDGPIPPGTQFLLCSQESGPCLLAGCQLGRRLASGVIEFLIT